MSTRAKFSTFIHNSSGLKLFLIGGILLIIVGEAADLILTQKLDLGFLIVIMILMAALLIFTMNKNERKEAGADPRS
jgi:MFS-type transporter involved in bile tolerance (Atg22 family)